MLQTRQTLSHVRNQQRQQPNQWLVKRRQHQMPLTPNRRELVAEFIVFIHNLYVFCVDVWLRLTRNGQMRGARILRSEAYLMYAAATKDSCNTADGRLSSAALG
jgi:hypothetical protein